MGAGPWDVEAARNVFLPHDMEEMAVISGVQSGIDCAITKGFGLMLGTARWGYSDGSKHRWESKGTSQP